MRTYERILLTGGSGFVGRHTAAVLAETFPDARRVSMQRAVDGPPPHSFSAATIDLLDESAVDRLVADLRPDLVVHLAGQASIGHAAGAAEQTWRINFHGAFGLAAAIARHSPGAVALFSSTATAYGASFRDGVLAEDAPLRPMDIYSRSKVAAEGGMADVLGPDARLIVTRPVNHSGPGQRSRAFVLASFAAQIAEIEAGRAAPRLRVGDLSRKRDFLDVRDVVDAYLRLIQKADELPERVSIFNVASGAAPAISDLLATLRGMSRRPFEVEVDPALLRPSATDIACVACDASKLRAATGWRPRYAITDTLSALLDEWRDACAGGHA
jgi:GDP-4-dehydro-6-deoxy-D-mannose reductase